MRFFQLYQYIVPLLFFPLAYWLWLQRYDGNHQFTLAALSFPIVFSYVIPGIGTNRLKIWKFHTRFKIGRFRPQHGFLFGTATSLVALVALDYPRELNLWEVLRAGFVMGSIIGFVNWWYDTAALKVNFLCVYNQAFASGKDPESVAFQYCPIFFGAFGLCYGMAVRILELVVIQQQNTEWFWGFMIAIHSLLLSLPVLAYVAYSKMTIGQTGLRSYDPGVLANTSSTPSQATNRGTV